ncbi:hypothetical protein RND71_009559 [Anisodus tanguticus]|uniref:Uncharacterized protein n=1 Tax=Anisodus tanguticus TaxID=243964 RepID=A0AAE1SI98_9SOLA|nr:hypothetical protein RND71_009559 [Anisodus tanguticus]
MNWWGAPGRATSASQGRRWNKVSWNSDFPCWVVKDAMASYEQVETPVHGREDISVDTRSKENYIQIEYHTSLTKLCTAFEMWRYDKGMEFMDDSLDDTISSCKLHYYVTKKSIGRAYNAFEMRRYDKGMEFMDDSLDDTISSCKLHYYVTKKSIGRAYNVGDFVSIAALRFFSLNAQANLLSFGRRVELIVRLGRDIKTEIGPEAQKFGLGVGRGPRERRPPPSQIMT